MMDYYFLLVSTKKREFDEFPIWQQTAKYTAWGNTNLSLIATRFVEAFNFIEFTLIIVSSTKIKNAYALL